MKNYSVSFDVDIFLTHSAALIEIFRNPKIDQITDKKEFPGNYLKLIRDEGEIDTPAVLDRLYGIDLLRSGFERVFQRIELLEKNMGYMTVELAQADPELQKRIFEICLSGLNSTLGRKKS